MLSRNVITVKTNVSNQLLEVPVVGNHPARIRVERSVVTVVVPTFHSNVLPMAKNVSNARRTNISQNFVGVQIQCQVGNPKHFSRKLKFMKWKKQSSNMTLIFWSLNESNSQHLKRFSESLRISFDVDFSYC